MNIYPICTEQPETAVAYCDRLVADGLEYSAEFVPFSQSRNAGEKDLSLNWRATLRKGSQSLTTDYQQGIGHIPGYKSTMFAKMTVREHEQLTAACEQGRVKFQKIKPPTLHEILYCLLSDSDAIDCACFEDWADSYGYETDSRKAEAIYKACLAIGLKLRQLIDIDEAMRHFEDY